ncbi:MAG: DUF4058 family protein [Anaerolineae bacterium]
MPSPFPGMDPYLEQPDLWPEVHARLIVAIADALGPLLRPKYRIAVERRIYKVRLEAKEYLGRPDVAALQAREAQVDYRTSSPALARPVAVLVPMFEEVRESYLEVRSVPEGEVIAVIEVLSPTNKRPGAGRQQYEQKRQRVLDSKTHLVEIDLLRDGQPMPFSPLAGPELESIGDYRILVSRARRRPYADLFPFNLADRIPVFLLPLRSPEEEPPLDVGRLLHELYDRAGYDLSLDYSLDTVPPLSEAQRAWANKLLGEKDEGTGR